MSDSNLISIKNKIDSTAYMLFKEWTKIVKSEFLDLDITIKDEFILIEDLTNTIESALVSVSSKKNIGKTINWKVGFFWGFIQSNLNLHWCNEYINNQSNMYHMITMLQSIMKLLVAEENIREQILNIYESKLVDKTNLLYCNLSILATKETVMSHMEIPLLSMLNHEIDHPSIVCCENIINKMINEFTELDNKNYLPEMENYFNFEEVSALIRKNL